MPDNKPYTTVSNNSNKSEEEKEKRTKKKERRFTEIANSILRMCSSYAATTEYPLSTIFVTGARSLVRIGCQRERIASRYR